jgi:hypothetical protein
MTWTANRDGHSGAGDDLDGKPLWTCSGRLFARRTTPPSAAHSRPCGSRRIESRPPGTRAHSRPPGAPQPEADAANRGGIVAAARGEQVRRVVVEVAAADHAEGCGRAIGAIRTRTGVAGEPGSLAPRCRPPPRTPTPTRSAGNRRPRCRTRRTPAQPQDPQSEKEPSRHSSAYWHTHEPLLQDSPGAQDVPHEPQLKGSPPRSTHAPPQSIGHVTHAPLVQTALAGQAWPQEPQLAGSEPRSTHAPPQTVAQGAQAPLVQASPARHA